MTRQQTGDSIFKGDYEKEQEIIDDEYYINVKNYGVKGDGIADDTVAIQSAINYVSINGGILFFPVGIYKYSSLTISKPITILGVSSNHMFNKTVDTSIGVKLADLPPCTIFQQTSLTSPGLSLATPAVQSGLTIEGILFYQEHADYAHPTAYPYTISDEGCLALGTGYWSGITIKRCMFVNAYKGISLYHCERYDLENIDGDFFKIGISTSGITDVSRMVRIHIFSFARSNGADAYKNTLTGNSAIDTDYAIKCGSTDEVYMEDVFIYNRYYGIFLSNVWGSANNLTWDSVGQPMTMINPKNFAFMGNNWKINCENSVGNVTSAISITGDSNPTGPSLILNGISIWKGSTVGKTYSYNSAILIDYPALTAQLDNIKIRYALTEGIKITSAIQVMMNGIMFDNSFPNQTAGVAFDLTTVGIRNESTTAIISIDKAQYGPLIYLFDGYIDNVDFGNRRESIISTVPAVRDLSGGSALTSTSTNGVKQVTFVGADPTAQWTGLRMHYIPYTKQFVSGHYLFGAEYMVNSTLINTGAPGDTRYISLPIPTGSGLSNHVSLNPVQTTSKRLALIVINVSASGVPTYGGYARTFSGSLTVYKVFCIPARGLFSYPIGEPPDLKVPAAPATASVVWDVGKRFNLVTPTTAGNTATVCTSAGAPGTWITI